MLPVEFANRRVRPERAVNMRGHIAILLGCVVLQSVMAQPVFSDARSPQSPADRRPAARKHLVEIAAGRMTAELAEAPLATVLEIIAKKTGALIFLHGSAEETVTVEFRQQPLEEGMRRILRGKNAAYFYAAKSSAPGKAALLALSEVRIFGLSGSVSEQATIFAATQSGMEIRGPRGMVESAHKATDPLTAELARRLLEAKDSQARKEAAAALARVSDPAALGALGQALTEDAEASVRAAAADALGKTWDEDAVAPLAQAVLGDSSASVREAAARALGATWSEYAVSSLTMALANDPAAMVREQAARALAQTAGEEAVQALTQALTQDPRWFVRDGVASALGAIGGRDALEALGRSATDDRDEWVRETAALAAVNSAR